MLEKNHEKNTHLNSKSVTIDKLIHVNKCQQACKLYGINKILYTYSYIYIYAAMSYSSLDAL